MHVLRLVNKYLYPLMIILICSQLYGCSSPTELKWHQEEGYQWAETSAGWFGSTGFKELSSRQTGITFQNKITEEEIAENRHYMNGSGVAAGDIDGDGLVDLYFAKLNGSNKLYKNLGNMKFEDITDRAGVAHNGYYSTGVVFADINGNGHLDLLVTSINRENVLYVNDGNGNFERKNDSGLGDAKGGTTFALADITGNGFPDLYITNYKKKSVKDIYTTQELDWNNILKEPLRQPEDEYTFVPPFDQHYELMRYNGALTGISEIGEKDELYLNKEGRFEKVTNTENVFLDEQGEPFGIQPDWGLTAKFQDINNDGLEDLYVCNDFHTPNRIWINQGNSSIDKDKSGIGVRFRAIGEQAIRNMSYSCMAVDFSDVNRDGRLDMFTTEMLAPEHQRRMNQVKYDDNITIPIGDVTTRTLNNRNSMQLQREDNTYAETSWFSGVEASGWSWATRFMDIDLDGYEDLIISTGYAYDVLNIDAQVAMAQKRRNMDENYIELIQSVKPLKLQNKMFKNNADSTFSEISSDWGFTESDVSYGMAVADLNNDGALDIAVNRLYDQAAIFQNTTQSSRITVRLKGSAPNTQAIGANVELFGGPVDQQKQITSGGEYASGSDNLVMFAADSNNPNHKLFITWPDGTKSQILDVKANRIYEIDQSSIKASKPSTKSCSRSGSNSMFLDISERLKHIHTEVPFDDFSIQPFLPFKLSQIGPGMAWIDLTGNGNDELLVTSGKGGELAIFSSQEDGNFIRSSLSPLTKLSRSDQTAVLGWQENDHLKVLTGNSNYEQGNPAKSSAFIYTIERNSSEFHIQTDSISGVHSATGPLAVADMTGNGYLDLFVGGRFKPGQYPVDASSRLFLNDGNSFQLDSMNTRIFSEIGMVTGAIFADFTQDGYADLLISTEWGSLRLFENREGVFEEITKEVGLANYKGWWNGVATGDFTNDGLPDIIATNIGLNTPYQLRNGYPLKIYYGNLDGFNTINIIEAYATADGNYVPRKQLGKFQKQQIMLNRMGSHEEFANSTMQEILGNRYNLISFKEINTLEHMLFINTGNGFKAQPLPSEAQIAMAFNATVADVDSDGNEDLFLSQNFFAVSDDFSRMDAGRGLLLKGDGKGNFNPLSGTESGIKIYGEQRSAILNDINKDGKIDLAVSQNGAETKLFLNQSQRVGYTIKLNGPSSNRNGVGSSLRLVYENGKKGPRRDIQASSGYLSQNSFTQVMGAADKVKEIEVFWFDGFQQTVAVVEDKVKYIISYPSEHD